MIYHVMQPELTNACLFCLWTWFFAWLPRTPFLIVKYARRFHALFPFRSHFLQGLQVVVRSNTVDRLKHIITGFNEECGTALSKSGKKQDLIERINRQLESWRMSQQADKFTKGKAVIHQVRTSGS